MIWVWISFSENFIEAFITLTISYVLIQMLVLFSMRALAFKLNSYFQKDLFTLFFILLIILCILLGNFLIFSLK